MDLETLKKMKLDCDCKRGHAGIKGIEVEANEFYNQEVESYIVDFLKDQGLDGLPCLRRIFQSFNILMEVVTEEIGIDKLLKNQLIIDTKEFYPMIFAMKFSEYIIERISEAEDNRDEYSEQEE